MTYGDSQSISADNPSYTWRLMHLAQRLMTRGFTEPIQRQLNRLTNDETFALLEIVADRTTQLLEAIEDFGDGILRASMRGRTISQSRKKAAVALRL